tara:strand:+ start:236 stop:724 length:489 start_codon:yes stop_codon:yes gene_type:complete
MKRLLLTPLILGLLSPFSAIAQEQTFDCFELGKQNCAYKLVAIGTCAEMMLENSGETKEVARNKAHGFYKALAKQLNYFPTKEERSGPEDGSGLEATRNYVKAHCPKELTTYALNDFVNSEAEKKGRTLELHKSMILTVKPLTFSLGIDLRKIFEDKEREAL